MENASLPYDKVVRKRGCKTILFTGALRSGWSIKVHEAGEVLKYLIVKRLVGYQQNFVLHLQPHREPVQILEERCYMVVFPRQ